MSAGCGLPTSSIAVSHDPYDLVEGRGVRLTIPVELETFLPEAVEE